MTLGLKIFLKLINSETEKDERLLGSLRNTDNLYSIFTTTKEPTISGLKAE